MFQENSIETCILSRLKQITSPGWMHETSPQAWCAGKTRGIGWRGRGEGGSGWGIHVTPWLIHVSVWQNPLKCCEVISLQLIKINEKNKNKKIKSTEWTWVKWFKKENNQDPPPHFICMVQLRKHWIYSGKLGHSQIYLFISMTLAKSLSSIRSNTWKR